MANRNGSLRNAKSSLWQRFALIFSEEGIWGSKDLLIAACGVLGVCAVAHLFIFLMGDNSPAIRTYLFVGSIFFGMLSCGLAIRLAMIVARQQRKRLKKSAKARGYVRELEKAYYED